MARFWLSLFLLCIVLFSAIAADPTPDINQEQLPSFADLRAFAHHTAPAWSPDSRQILFATAGGEGKNQLFMVSAAAGEPRLLGPGNRWHGAPAWNQQGNRIAFAADRG